MTDTPGPDLAAYVGAGDADQAFVDSCLAEARALVDGLVGEAEIPTELVERCYLEVGSELYHRRQAPNGITQHLTLGGAPIRVARDPLVGVYPLLAHHLGPGLA